MEKRVTINIMRHPPKIFLNHYVKGDSSERNEFIQNLYQGLANFGSVLLKGHGIAPERIQSAYRCFQNFFNLPEEIKKKYFDQKMAGQRGYVPFGKERAKDSKAPDLKEFFHVGRELSENHPYIKNKVYHPNIWPKEIHEMEENLKEFFTLLDNLGQHLLCALEEALEAPKGYFQDIIKNGNTILRGIHYPPLDGLNVENSIRAGAHGDINFITLLVCPTESGLELLDRSEKRWIPMDSYFGEIEIHVGDMLSRITNQIIPTSIHRVVNPKCNKTSRYSMPFFVHPNPEAILKCLPSCVQNKEKFLPINAHDFLMQRLKDINLAY